jgi:membrane protein implicated in regulation of membrane protease activity
LVHTWWQKHPKDSKSENSLDVGQTVVFESWVNESGKIARVKYRGSSWDARVDGSPQANDVLTIQSAENGVLHVSSASA